MLCNNLLKILTILCAIQFSLAAVLREPLSPLITNETKGEFDKQMRLETENFLNNIFANQINFFNKVKSSLNSNSQRYQDIETYVLNLAQAKREKNLDKKDELYYESLNKIDKISLFLNKREETGLDDADYQKVLEDNGLKDLMKNFLADVAAYFWKMAKHSGKVVESTVDRLVDNMQKEKVAI